MIPSMKQTKRVTGLEPVFSAWKAQERAQKLNIHHSAHCQSVRITATVVAFRSFGAFAPIPAPISVLLMPLCGGPAQYRQPLLRRSAGQPLHGAAEQFHLAHALLLLQPSKRLQCGRRQFDCPDDSCGRSLRLLVVGHVYHGPAFLPKWAVPYHNTTQVAGGVHKMTHRVVSSGYGPAHAATEKLQMSLKRSQYAAASTYASHTEPPPFGDDDMAPLVKGGQGRTGSELRDAAEAATWVVLLILVTACVWLCFGRSL